MIEIWSTGCKIKNGPPKHNNLLCLGGPFFCYTLYEFEFDKKGIHYSVVLEKQGLDKSLRRFSLISCNSIIYFCYHDIWNCKDAAKCCCNEFTFQFFYLYLDAKSFILELLKRKFFQKQFKGTTLSEESFFKVYWFFWLMGKMAYYNTFKIALLKNNSFRNILVCAGTSQSFASSKHIRLQRGDRKFNYCAWRNFYTQFYKFWSRFSKTYYFWWVIQWTNIRSTLIITTATVEP